VPPREAWLIRHAESLANIGGAASDPAGIDLSDTGRAQAQALVPLFDKAPDLVVISPFLRTHRTAGPLMAAFPHVLVETWPAHEFTYLDPARWAHTTPSARRPHVEAYWQRLDPDYCDGNGAESFSSLLHRAAIVQGRLRQRPERFIALFSHGIFLQTLLFRIRNADASPAETMAGVRRALDENPIANTAVLKIVP